MEKAKIDTGMKIEENDIIINESTSGKIVDII